MISGDSRRLLLVHAHPDDESLTTGATMARYAAEGVEVTLVTCTLGEEGEIIPPALEQLGSWAADQLGGYRSGELAAACSVLDVSRHHYLGGIGRWRDSGMAGTPAAEHPRAFTRGSIREQAGQLGAILADVRPQVVVTYDESGGYGHPDHIRAHEVTMAAATTAASVRRVFHTAAPASATERGLAALRTAGDVPFRIPADGELPTVADDRAGTTIDVAEHLETKVTALRAHGTQVTMVDHPRCFALSNGIAQPLLAAEYFVLAHGPAEGADSDLFGGLDT